MTNREVQILAIEAAKVAFDKYSGTDSMPQPSEAYQDILEANRAIFGDSGNNLIIDDNLQWRQFKSHYWMQLALEMWKDYKNEL